MRRAPARMEKDNGAALAHGVRRQVIFSCAVFIGALMLTGVLLGTIAYGTMREYQTSAQMTADIYELSDGLDKWEAALSDYVLNSTDLSRQICAERWREIGQLLGRFQVADSEPLQLALDNIQALYDHTRLSQDLLFHTGDGGRVELYQTLCREKEGLSFLTDHLRRLHTENTVERSPVVISSGLTSFGIFLLILLFSCALTVTGSMRVIRSVCVPIDLLVEGAERVSGGQYDGPDIEIISNDELGYLSQVFNHMKAEVSANFKNLERILELQKLLQSAELKALQSQINPHFLFNVLSVAEESALHEDADGTVEVLENISYMLQYSLKCTRQDTTLKDELRMVRAYLFLQEKRFGDRIRFSFSAPEDIPPIQIPGMSLQPIVENAIGHGLEKRERDGALRVEVTRQGDFLAVTVADNGCGMDPEFLAAIQRGENVSSKGGSGGIGLLNVRRRMELFFRRDGLFEITSLPWQGTTVTLRYPCTESRVDHV